MQKPAKYQGHRSKVKVTCFCAFSSARYPRAVLIT